MITPRCSAVLVRRQFHADRGMRSQCLRLIMYKLEGLLVACRRIGRAPAVTTRNPHFLPEESSKPAIKTFAASKARTLAKSISWRRTVFRILPIHELSVTGSSLQAIPMMDCAWGLVCRSNKYRAEFCHALICPDEQEMRPGGARQYAMTGRCRTMIRQVASSVGPEDTRFECA